MRSKIPSNLPVVKPGISMGQCTIDIYVLDNNKSQGNLTVQPLPMSVVVGHYIDRRIIQFEISGCVVYL